MNVNYQFCIIDSERLHKYYCQLLWHQSWELPEITLMTETNNYSEKLNTFHHNSSFTKVWFTCFILSDNSSDIDLFISYKLKLTNNSLRLLMWWQLFFSFSFSLYADFTIRFFSSYIQYWLSLSLSQFEFTTSHWSFLLLHFYICLLHLVSLLSHTFFNEHIFFIKMFKSANDLAKLQSNTSHIFLRCMLRSFDSEYFAQINLSISLFCKWFTWYLFKLICSWSLDDTAIQTAMML